VVVDVFVAVFVVVVVVVVLIRHQRPMLTTVMGGMAAL
jgi:hypothetical protein